MKPRNLKAHWDHFWRWANEPAGGPNRKNQGMLTVRYWKEEKPEKLIKDGLFLAFTWPIAMFIWVFFRLGSGGPPPMILQAFLGLASLAGIVAVAVGLVRRAEK